MLRVCSLGKIASLSLLARARAAWLIVPHHNNGLYLFAKLFFSAHLLSSLDLCLHLQVRRNVIGTKLLVIHTNCISVYNAVYKTTTTISSLPPKKRDVSGLSDPSALFSSSSYPFIIATKRWLQANQEASKEASKQIPGSKRRKKENEHLLEDSHFSIQLIFFFCYSRWAFLPR